MKIARRRMSGGRVGKDAFLASAASILRRGGLGLLMLPLTGGLVLAAKVEEDTGLAATPRSGSPTWAESLENLGRLHHEPDHPWLQEAWFLGRYHGQYHWAEGTAGENQGWEDRRFRLGGQAQLFEHLTLHAQMVSGSDFDPFYNGFTELWAAWAFARAAALTVGQQKHRFTHDRTVSSRYLNTIERSLLVNLFAADYTPAVTLSGRSGRFSYYTGGFSNATGPDMGEAFTQLDSGYSFLASMTYDLGESLGTESAHVNVGYLHSEANENATNLNRYRDGLSAALVLTQGPVSLAIEGVAGLGSELGSAAQLNLQPGWFLTRKLELVGRYQLAVSDSGHGIRAQRRYELPAGLTTGDLYQAAYLGLNYYVAGHRAKLMAGAEYSTLGGEELCTVFTAVRVFWGPHSRGPFPIGQLLEPD